MSKKMLFRVFILITGLFLTLAGCSMASIPHTYYVSTSGNDANDCLSTAHACRTVAGAVTKATPRSLINIGAGTFPVQQAVNIWLDFHGAGQTLTILSGRDATHPAFTIADAVHASFTSLTISGGSNGIELDGVNIATQVTGTNITVSHAQSGISSTQGSAVILLNSSITSNVVGIITFRGKLDATNTLLTGNTQEALINSSTTVLDHVTIDHNGSGMFYPYGHAAIFNTTASRAIGGSTGPIKIVFSSISNNGENGIVNQGGQIGISESSITGNAGAGIDNYSSLIIDTSVVSQNGHDGIFINNLGTLSAHMQMTQTGVIQNGNAGVAIEAGTVSIANSTISGNHGIGLLNRGSTTLAYNTVAFNTSSGISAWGGSTSVLDSIIALNASPNCPYAVGLTIDHASLACNDALTNTTLKLGALTASAGTFVNPLQTGSPAINAGETNCPETSIYSKDQRGYARPYGTACDIGAYEFGASMALVAATPAAETPSMPVLQIVTATPSPNVPVLQIVTDTPTAQLAAVVIPTLNAFCRKGPGTLYDQVMVLQKGTAYNVIGRDSLNSWWQIQTTGSNTCWVGDANVSKQGPVEQAAIVQGAPLPGTPGNFVSSFVCNLKSKTLGVSFNWAGEAGVTGYRIYQNGSLLTTVAGNLTTYHEAAPLGMDLVYELEAFNAYGVAARSSTNVPACK